MKNKGPVLLSMIAILLASCASTSSFSSDSTKASSVSSVHSSSFSTSIKSSISDGSTILPSSSPLSSDPTSSFNSEFTLKGANQLRNPEGLSHKITYEQYTAESFVSFRNKMKSFSNKLSETITKRQFVDGENFTVSPLSIELCLGLAIRSADGETRRELLSALDMDYETFNTNYKLFYDYLFHEKINNMGNLTSQCLLTNSIWIDDEVTLKDSGLDALRDDYYCYAFDTDFNGDNAAANQAIKDFINYNTKGLINPDLGLSPTTLFVLMNTVYIKDIWNEYGRDLGFAPENIQFKNSDGSKSNKRLLSGHYNDGKKIVTDDYSCFYTSTNNGYNIYFIRPNEGKNLKDIFNKSVMDSVTEYKNYVKQDATKLERYHTNCYFPEFEVSGDIDLTSVFQEDLNVTSLFNPSSCDFSNLADSQVYCSNFKQLAKLKVNKTGIEGAAVTYMEYAGAVGPGEYEDVYETFIVDKEFGFVLTYNNSVVFSGIVNNIDK